MIITLHRFLLEALDKTQTDHVIKYAGAPVMSIKHAFNLTATRAGLTNVIAHATGAPPPEQAAAAVKTLRRI